MQKNLFQLLTVHVYADTVGTVDLFRKSAASRAKWQLKDAEISQVNSKVGN